MFYSVISSELRNIQELEHEAGRILADPKKTHAIYTKGKKRQRFFLKNLWKIIASSANWQYIISYKTPLSVPALCVIVEGGFS
jgi:hypothetical protein